MNSLRNISSKITVFFFAFVVSLTACAPVQEPAISLIVSDSRISHDFPDTERFLIAVLPFENLSGKKAPLLGIRVSLQDILKKKGINILGEEALNAFMERHRVRYTGMIDMETAGAFKGEIGTDAVLITSLELFQELNPPKIVLMSRLISTANNAEILWMDSAALTGDDAPGILALGLVKDPMVLAGRAVENLSSSLIAYLRHSKTASNDRKKRKRYRPEVTFSFESNEFPSVIENNKKTDEEEIVKQRFDPKVYYRSPILSPGLRYRIAVIPFLNRSDRKYAGEIMTLNFIKQLRAFGNFDVIEPGIIRRDFLQHRVILKEGISFRNADIIFLTLGVDADLILTGTVLEYEDYQGAVGRPKVDFSVVMIERKSLEVVFISKSYDTGDEGVYFFDHGKVRTAHKLSSEMIRAVIEMMGK